MIDATRDLIGAVLLIVGMRLMTARGRGRYAELLAEKLEEGGEDREPQRSL